MNIPFVDLRAQHKELEAEINAVFARIIENSSFIGGPLVENFEKNFASYCGVTQAVACASGTDALKLALMAAGVRAGEEVITVPLTFIATVEGITQIGAFPAFVDIDSSTYTLSSKLLREFLGNGCRLGKDGRPVNIKTGRTVGAVLPVHLYGLPADMTPILNLAAKYGLWVVEDAAQAHGAIYIEQSMERRVGSFGRTAAFSFYPGKNLGAMGEGGAVTTSDKGLEDHMRIWRDHGQSERYIHSSPDGWNGRLDALHCAILDLKLKKLDGWNDRRRKAARWYRERLEPEERIILPAEPNGRKHVYHLFVVRLPDREKVRNELAKKGIGVGLHYPIPLHLQKAYLDMGWQRGDFPESEAAAASILSLPIFPHITEEQVDYVCQCLKEVLG